jgi:hypothetical protein
VDYAQAGLAKIGEGITAAEGATAEYLEKKGVNPYVAAAVPMAAEIGASMLIPGPKRISGSFLKPSVPIERRLGVQAAAEENIPLLRSQQTGSRVMAGVENIADKSVLGSKVMDASRLEGDQAMEAFRTRIRPEAKGIGDVGTAAKLGRQQREQAMKATKNEMFERVPENVSIPLSKSKQMADTLQNEQSQLYGGTQSPEVLRWSKIVNDAELSSGKGVTGGPEVSGVTSQIPDRIIPPSTKTTQSSLVGERGQLISYEQNIPGQTIKGGPEYGVKYSVGPEEQFAPKNNYFALKKLRENLGEAVKQAKTAGKYQDFRDLTRLKASLDTDIDDFVKNQDTPLGQMVGKEFSESYRKANAFSGAYKKLFEGDESDFIKNAPPEKIFEKVFKENNETAIKKFRALVGEDAFKEGKHKWMSDLLDSNNVKKDLGKYEQGTLDAMLSKPEQEKLRKFAEVQDLRKSNLQGTQGSARSNVQTAQYGGLGYGLLAALRGDLLGAAAGIGQFVAPYPAAKALTSEAVRKGVNYSIPGAFGKPVMAEYVRQSIEEKKNRLKEKANASSR